MAGALAKVGGTSFGADDVVRSLRQTHAYRRTMDEVVNHHLVLEACKKHGLRVTDDELQQAVNRMRLLNGLTSAADTQAWMSENGISHEDLEANLEYQMSKRKLVTKVFGADALAKRVKDKPEAYTRVALSKICVESEDLANDVADQLRSEEESFAALARRHSTCKASKASGGMVGWVDLASLAPAVRDAVRASSGDGEIVGPVRADDRWHVLQVNAIEKPQLDYELEDRVLADLVREWLEAERKQVVIEIQ